MSNSKFNPAALHELAPFYALDALDSDDKQQFEDHLRSGCEACELELRSMRDVATGIAAAVATDPPARLRDRLMERVARTPRAPGIAYNESGILVARSQEISWKSIAPGISYKPLYRDEARNADTVLVRMDAGCSYPSHRHTQVEELFMLSGDLRIEDQVIYAGDYCRADLGSVHKQSFTEGGCMFLMMAAPDNQLLA